MINLFFAQKAYAQAPTIGGADKPAGGPIIESSWKDLFASGSLGNRSATFNNAIDKYINILLVVATIAAIFFVLYYGLMMINSNGNEDKFKQAKQGLVATIIGIIIVTLSVVIAVAVRQLAITASV